ncbi:hypothetical protein D9M72_370540 [compost metagenome]
MLDADVERDTHRLEIAVGEIHTALAQDLQPLSLDPSLDTGNADIVDIDGAEHMGGERSVGIKALLLALEADSGNAGVPDGLFLRRRYLTLDPGKGCAALQPSVEIAPVDVREDRGQLLDGLVDIDDQPWFGIKPGTRHIDRQQIAVPVEDRRAAKARRRRYVAGPLIVRDAKLDEAREHEAEDQREGADDKEEPATTIRAGLNLTYHINRARCRW